MLSVVVFLPLSGAIAIFVFNWTEVLKTQAQLKRQVVAALKKYSGRAIVEPAHMELAEPSLEQAYAACVEQVLECSSAQILLHCFISLSLLTFFLDLVMPTPLVTFLHLPPNSTDFVVLFYGNPSYKLLSTLV